MTMSDAPSCVPVTDKTSVSFTPTGSEVRGIRLLHRTGVTQVARHSTATRIPPLGRSTCRCHGSSSAGLVVGFGRRVLAARVWSFGKRCLGKLVGVLSVVGGRVGCMKDDVGSIIEQVTEVGGLLDDVLNLATGPDQDGAGADRCSVDDLLRELLVGLETVRNATEAAQAHLMVQMGVQARAADEAEVAAGGDPLWSGQRRAEFVADEIGVLLSCTKMAASARYDTALRAADVPVVCRAWRQGVVDARRVATICEQVSYLDVATAEIVAGEAVDYATAPGRCRTAPQLREWLRRRVVAANPGAAEQRRQQAIGGRRVVITPGDDGMSELWALLPSVQARQIQQALSAAAQQLGAGAGGDARSMDQRRADTLVDLLLGRAEPAPVSIGVIVRADTLSGASHAPGWVTGLGPITSGEVNELVGVGERARTVTFRRLLTDPATGLLTDRAEKRYRPSAALDRAVRARDVTCRFPGCRRGADSIGTDLDHTVPWPTGPTSATNLAVLCRRHHRLKHTPGWNAQLDPTGTMTWTTPTGRTYQTEPWRYTDPDPPTRE